MAHTHTHTHFILFQCAALSAPYDGSSTLVYLDHRCEGIGAVGGMGRRSRLLDMTNRGTHATATKVAAAIVLRCQLRGLAHQPPVGLHTYFGYSNFAPPPYQSVSNKIPQKLPKFKTRDATKETEGEGERGREGEGD